MQARDAVAPCSAAPPLLPPPPLLASFMHASACNFFCRPVPGNMPAPGGGAVDEAALLHPADFWEPVADRDCRVELVVPPEPAAEQQGRATRVTRVTRKRQREEEEEEEEPRVVVVEAASQLLKAASQKFRCVAFRRLILLAMHNVHAGHKLRQGSLQIGLPCAQCTDLQGVHGALGSGAGQPTAH